MKIVLSLIMALVAAQAANAELVSTDSQKVEIEIKSAVFELTAKCNRPQFEDDAYTVYFSDESYKEAASYINGGYSKRLLNKTCGTNGTGPELSENTFEKVTVYFVDGQTPRAKLEEAVKAVWEAKN